MVLYSINNVNTEDDILRNKTRKNYFCFVYKINTILRKKERNNKIYSLHKKIRLIFVFK